MKRISFFLSSLGAAFILSGCFSFGDNYTVRTKFNPDGSLDRTVKFPAYDSVSRKGDQFGVADSTGWSVQVEKDLDSASLGRYIFTFAKHYESPDAANTDNTTNKGGYRISSSVKTTYRWFFTTVYYSDTYAPLMSFTDVSADEFFTQADVQWLDAAFRGDTLVTADTIRGAIVKDKVEAYMAYGWAFALTRELGKQMTQQGIATQWVDTLTDHTRDIGEFTRRADANEETLWVYLMDSLGLPLGTLRNTTLPRPDEVLASIPIFDEIEHTIEIPTTIATSNSLFVDQNTATWYLTPYAGVKEGVLYVESRTLNYPEILGTLVAVAALFIFLRRKRFP